MDKLRQYLINDDGVTAIEYGLIAAAMGVVLIASMPILSSAVTRSFSSLASHISSGQ